MIHCSTLYEWLGAMIAEPGFASSQFRQWRSGLRVIRWRLRDRLTGFRRWTWTLSRIHIRADIDLHNWIDSNQRIDDLNTHSISNNRRLSDLYDAIHSIRCELSELSDARARALDDARDRFEREWSNVEDSVPF